MQWLTAERTNADAAAREAREVYLAQHKAAQRIAPAELRAAKEHGAEAARSAEAAHGGGGGGGGGGEGGEGGEGGVGGGGVGGGGEGDGSPSTTTCEKLLHGVCEERTDEWFVLFCESSSSY